MSINNPGEETKDGISKPRLLSFPRWSKKIARFALVAVVLVVACAGLCYALLTLAFHNDQVCSPQPATYIAEVQARFKKLAESIAVLSTSDTLLAEPGPLAISTFHTAPCECVLGSRIAVYGTNRPFSDVETVFSPAGLRQLNLPQYKPPYPAYTNAEDVVQVILTNTDAQFSGVAVPPVIWAAPTSVPQPTVAYSMRQKYKIFYAVQLKYAEPSIPHCYG